jgi:dTDP-4-dehydrorhamnose reductase
MILEIIDRRITGTYHLAGATRISRYDFSKSIAQTFSLNTDLITPCSPSEFRWIAKRPKDSSLNTGEAQQMLRNKPLGIQEALSILKRELQ